MECSCDLCIDDFCEVIEHKTVTARKEHKCGECSEIIKPGENMKSKKSLMMENFQSTKRVWHAWKSETLIYLKDIFITKYGPTLVNACVVIFR